MYVWSALSTYSDCTMMGVSKNENCDSLAQVLVWSVFTSR